MTLINVIVIACATTPAIVTHRSIGRRPIERHAARPPAGRSSTLDKRPSYETATH
ncbi:MULTISPECIES: hypothetical protein [Burkholderia]|uniref:hypothetical protein n=1 Tax=Burkholderia TaxID=32008 RepID=UPI0012E3B7CF|nr:MULTISPECIES: hypothetical protein [Burkholderia]